MKKLIKYFLIIIILLLNLNQSLLAQKINKWEWLSKQTPLYQISDKNEINLILKKIHELFRDFNERFKAIMTWRLNTPYKLGCLGEEKPPDTKPLFRVDLTDCTVFVLTSTALVHSTTYEDARKMMTILNYYPVKDTSKDPVTYKNRRHFTYDRLHTSDYFVDITTSLVPKEHLKSKTLTLNITSDGKYLLDIGWKKKVTAYYIQQKFINNELLKKLPKICGVAFIREKNFKLGLIVSHEGIIADNKTLYHADSVEKKIEKINFLDYFFNVCDGYFDGVIFYEIK